MMRLRAFRPTSQKIEFHPTHPWLVSADDDDHVIYELRAGGVDYSRLVGAKLEKLAEGESEPRGKRAEALRGGSVKQVSFYDDDVIYWKLWHNRAAASETPVAVNNDSPPFSSPAPSTKGRHFLVVCCENKAVFLDLVTMRGRDVPKQDLDNKYTGGHKGPVSCLMTFMASSGQVVQELQHLKAILAIYLYITLLCAFEPGALSFWCSRREILGGMTSQLNNASDNEGSPEGSNDLYSNRNSKADRSRRIWSVREEEILMATLKELAANGWKSDNGFRYGYLVRAREAIKREFPNTDILPHPHIYSKITTWKRNYGSLNMMLNHSGIGFNSDGSYRIEADDEQWDLFCKKDRHAKYMRNKPWPQYEDWKEVFGQDRSDGERGVDVPTAASTIYGHENDVVPDEAISPHMTFAELFPDEPIPDGLPPAIIDDSQSVTEGGVHGSAASVDAGPVSGFGVCPVPAVGAASGPGTGARQKVTKKVNKKRKVEDKMDGVLSLMGQINSDTNDRLTEISKRIGYAFDLSNKRAEVFEQLKGIPGLSLKLQFYVCKKLVKEPELLDLFRGLPETARAAFVFDLLETDNMLHG
ncbi:hypothetical protein SASPL_133941 [Salvia splendens]|uniref:Myb/SANT-like domain-containing protein n=1 Tax=Salvia splendens TaxID=180675 RepID=A0A8X8X3M8_SALSN|nr:hypothetical protein SASPL_133941 [Salvia splendens]